MICKRRYILLETASDLNLPVRFLRFLHRAGNYASVREPVRLSCETGPIVTEPDRCVIE
ncbi:hypothetical protein JW948_05200 [bacterium]|nr:hypothetical protein [bacterium]